MFIIKQLENIINKITPIKDINPNIVYSNSVNKLLPDEPPKTVYVAWNNIPYHSLVLVITRIPRCILHHPKGNFQLLPLPFLV